MPLTLPILTGSLTWLCLSAISVFAQTAPCTVRPCCEVTNLGLQKMALNQYVGSGQYDRDIKAVVDQAKSYLALEAGRKGRLAIVLDIDETALSNWPRIKADDFGFFSAGPCNLTSDGTVQAPCGWDKWIDLKQDRPIVPILELYHQARKQGLKVFFITTRNEGERMATAANLHAEGYEGFSDEDLIMKPNKLDRGRNPRVIACFKSQAPAACFKTEKRGEIVDQGYTIILNIGDQDSDLSGGYAERTFKLPNPFYFLP
jgi:predicted secreted acid phosphatase